MSSRQPALQRYTPDFERGAGGYNVVAVEEAVGPLARQAVGGDRNAAGVDVALDLEELGVLVRPG